MQVFIRLGRIFIVGLLALLAFTPTYAQPAFDSVTFPETGYTVSGRFLEYWQAHGGLPVFGFPITNQSTENNRAVQYFERARFELHPENTPPYDVLLGRLGDEILQRQGIDWRTQPNSPGPVAGCYYFELTKHNVCNQQVGVGFLQYWVEHGLEFDGKPGKSYAESLALFGLPLTEPYQYTNSSGDTVQTQWFERARFEWHPNNPNAYKVLLGRLGAEYLNAGGTPPPTVDRVKVYFIALGDNGASGPQIGCNDSAVAVEVAIEPTPAPLTAAIKQLLAVRSEYYGQSGLYNALYQSNLTLASATVENGRATVYLTGDLRIGGVCDAPRVEAQLKQTARQFGTVDEAIIYVNGKRIEEVLSGR